MARAARPTPPPRRPVRARQRGCSSDRPRARRWSRSPPCWRSRRRSRDAVSLVAATALLAGALVADLRLSALDGGRLPSLEGRSITARAVLLEPVRVRLGGLATVRARLVDGSAPGEGAVLRVRAASHPGAWPRVGEIVAISGRVAPLGRFDAFQGRRGAVAAIEVSKFRATGDRRGGPAGVVDEARRRAEAGLGRGLAEPEAALVRGMVLGQDEQLARRRPRRLQALGPRPRARRERAERDAARDARARRRRGAGHRPPRAADPRARADRAVRPADRRRPVDPARRGHGRGRPRRGARRTAGAPLVRARARRGRHARAQPARLGRARLAALVRGRRRRCSPWRPRCASGSSVRCRVRSRTSRR